MLRHIGNLPYHHLLLRGGSGDTYLARPWHLPRAGSRSRRRACLQSITPHGRALLVHKQHGLDPVFQKRTERAKSNGLRASQGPRVAQFMADVGACLCAKVWKGYLLQISREGGLAKTAPEINRVTDEEIDTDALRDLDDVNPFRIVGVTV